MITVIEKAEALTQHIRNQQSKGLKIGFVPTMGALHNGHIRLVKKAKKENDIVVVSIFVNPTQFNDKKDLEKYPRTLDADLIQLMPTNADIVFFPDIMEIYPNGDAVGADIDLGGLDQYMEGAFRPGHFKGVAQVVKRLLDIVTPDHLYMGQKDFQQFTIIDHMIKNLGITTKLVVCPIIREKNGLAMSSRNERLSDTTREAASIIYKTLTYAKKKSGQLSPEEISTSCMKKLSISPFTPEYFTIVDGYKLTPIADFASTNYAVACVAVWADGVRLIDNIVLKKGDYRIL